MNPLVKCKNIYLIVYLTFCTIHSIVAQSIVHYSTIFSHGLHAGPLQLSKYTPRYASLETGELILSSRALNLLHGPISAPSFPEISMRNTRLKVGLWTRFMYRMTAFMDSWMYGYKIEKVASGPTLSGRSLSIFQHNFGQYADLDVLKKSYQEHIRLYPDSAVLMYGCSRGAAVTATFVCHEAHDAAQHVRLVVLEGCFDSSVSVIQERYSWLGKRFVAWVKRFFERNTLWREDGPSPLSSIAHWPDTIPVLFITSEKDKEVPMRCTRNLVAALKKHKPNVDVYLLVLKKSRHSTYAFDNQQDRTMYDNVVNAFYKKYGFICDESKAEAGCVLLEKIKQ